MSGTYNYIDRLHFLLNEKPNTEVWFDLMRVFATWPNNTTKDQVNWEEALRYLLRQLPDPNLWDAIRNLFVAWPSSDTRTKAIYYADTQLNHWENTLRHSSAGWGPLSDKKTADIGILLRSLQIYRMSEAGTSFLKSIAKSHYLSRLTHFSIYRCEEIDEVAFQSLAHSPYLHHLQHLEIHNSSLGMNDRYYNFISDDIDLWRKFDPSPMRVQFFDLMHSPVTANLRWLKLTSLSLEDWHVKILTSSSFTPNLEHLDLSDNYIGAEGAAFIANTPQLQNLAVLKLSRNGLYDTGALALAHSPYLHNLQELHLVTAHITQAGRQALEQAPHLRNTKIIFE